VIVGLHQVGGVLNHDAVDQPHRHRDGMLMYGGSLDAPRLTKWLSLYLEGAGQLTRVKLVKTDGAARVHTKSVTEMAADKASARANADAADKGKMTQAPKVSIG